MYSYVARVGLRARSVCVPARAEYRRAGRERRAECALGLAVPRRSRLGGPEPAPRAAAASRTYTFAPSRTAVASARIRPPLQDLAMA